RRPISRLTAKNVRSGLVTAWRLAGWPTRRSPSSVNATIEGVVRIPSEFSMTFGVEPSITATQELVVPRSIPMTLAMICYLSFQQAGPGPCSAPAQAGGQANFPPCLIRPPVDHMWITSRRSPLRRLGTYRRAVVARKADVHENASSNKQAGGPTT